LKPEDLRIVEPPSLVRDHALTRLRNAITTGLYPPGKRLVERELCEALGVSRTSVREALRQLQSERLVESGPNRTIRVARITARDAEDIYTLREMLQTLAIKRFVREADANAVKQLERVHKDMRKALRRGNVEQLAAIAGAFYETILAGSGSRVVQEVARQLLARVDFLRFRAMSEPGRLADGLREWDMMIDAVRRRDGEAAAGAMAAHLRNSRAAVVSRLLADEQAESRLAG
jgi:DNA-binding GntR family transcriptional regulator